MTVPFHGDGRNASKATADRPVRVMHVVNALGLAGMEYGVIKLAGKMDSSRVVSLICCLGYRSEETDSLVPPEVTVYELGKRPGLNLRIVLRLADAIRREQIDLLHSRNWPTFFFSVLAARLARVGLIHGEHGRESQAVRPAQVRWCRWLSCGVDRISTVNENIAGDLEHLWQVRPERITVIRNGVDLEAFKRPEDSDDARREFGWTAGEQIVLNVGGLRPVKDHTTLLRAMAQLIERVPSARLLVVGTDWESGIREQLGRLAAELGIESHVHFAGVRYDVPRLLALCEVYVNTSIFEGMANSVLEAMAASRPVIATNVGGNPELVCDGETGLLFQPGDVDSLTEHMERLLKHNDLAQNMGAAGRRLVAQRYSLARMVDEYTEMYYAVSLRRKMKRNCRARETLKLNMARIVVWTGFNRLRRAVRPRELTILTYHRVLPLKQASEYAFQGMVMPCDVFEAQMAYLARNYDVMPLSEAVSRLARGQLPRRAVSLTFDDGYCDNYQHASPFLRRHGLTATFFLITGALDRKLRPWWDDVDDTLARLQASAVRSVDGEERLPDWLHGALSKLCNGIRRQTITQELVDFLNGVSLSQRKEALELMEKIAGPQSTPRDNLMLTWDQVREMHADGMEFGAHTVSHAFLDELDEEKGRQEIEDSLIRIADVIGAPVRMFAYPRGRAAAVAKPWLCQAGVEVAVTTERGANGPGADPLLLRRIDAGWGQLDRGFDPNHFETELAGWFDWLRRS